MAARSHNITRKWTPSQVLCKNIVNIWRTAGFIFYTFSYLNLKMNPFKCKETGFDILFGLKRTICSTWEFFLLKKTLICFWLPLDPFHRARVVRTSSSHLPQTKLNWKKWQHHFDLQYLTKILRPIPLPPWSRLFANIWDSFLPQASLSLLCQYCNIE